jgi:hypothetical protein
MAITLNVYNHTRLRIVSGLVPTNHAYRCTLYSTLDFTATATTKFLAESGGTQLPSANGYTQNAQVVAEMNYATQATDGARLSCNNIIWVANGGSIAASAAMIYNATQSGQPPLFHIDFGETLTALDGEPFVIAINADGLMNFLPSASS